MEYILVILIVAFGYLIEQWRFNIKRKRRAKYYNEVYLKSDAWRKKRYVVLKRDNWLCVHCGEKATQVHHTRYATKNIGREPIKWLQSVCEKCHTNLHL